MKSLAHWSPYYLKIGTFISSIMIYEMLLLRSDFRGQLEPMQTADFPKFQIRTACSVLAQYRSPDPVVLLLNPQALDVWQHVCCLNQHPGLTLETKHGVVGKSIC